MAMGSALLGEALTAGRGWTDRQTDIPEAGQQASS